MTTTILVNTNLIPLAMPLFLIEKNARFEVFWPQLRSLKQQHLPPNLFTPDMKQLVQ